MAITPPIKRSMEVRAVAHRNYIYLAISGCSTLGHSKKNHKYPRSSDVYPWFECASLPWPQGHNIAIPVSDNPTSLRDTQFGAVRSVIEERVPVERFIAHHAHVEFELNRFNELALFDFKR